LNSTPEQFALICSDLDSNAALFRRGILIRSTDSADTADLAQLRE
jgi:hypothetical protein